MPVLNAHSTVTAANGLHLHPSETISLRLEPSDKLYAFAATGSPTVHVLQIQKID